ncbi:hypothetical protein OH491_16875 [Termitidicoccus mucosus]
MNTQNKTNPVQISAHPSAQTPARASAGDDAFFTDPVGPKAEARAMAAEAITHVLLWISEGTTLEQHGLRASLVLHQVRPDLIGGMTLEEIGGLAGCTRQTVHKLADDFRKNMGLVS